VDDEVIKKKRLLVRAEWIVVYKAGSKQCKIKISRLSLRTGVFSFGKEAGTAGQCSEKSKNNGKKTAMMRRRW
jgi:hypothetical protein